MVFISCAAPGEGNTPQCPTVLVSHACIQNFNNTAQTSSLVARVISMETKAYTHKQTT